ncbi:spore coat U domain-containing protein [bacterium]|nr:spore coat U domain-containing protein [bacterium]
MKSKFNQSNIKLGIVSAIVVGSAGISTASYATSIDDNMTVQTTVVTACSVTAPTLLFADYSGSEITATANISSNCTNGGQVLITLDEGVNPAAGSDEETNPERQMYRGSGSSNDDFMSYSLFTDSNKGTEWGTSANNDVPVTGTGSAVTTPVTGVIPAGETSKAGTYQDTVKVILSY